MNHYTSSSNSRNARTLIAGLLTYMLLVSQLTPLALGANPSFRGSPAKASDIARDKTSGRRSRTAEPVNLAPLPALAPNIVATKVDSYAGSPGPASPGQVITYDVTISNTGTADATGVQFTDTVDTNTSLIPGSINTQPITGNDTYPVLGNVRIQVPDGTSDLLNNDVDPGTGTNAGLTITTLAGDGSAPFAGTSTQGGQVTATTGDGSFTYNPPPGFEGTDTFTYTVTGTGGKTDTATVTLNVTGMIWFIDAAAAPAGDGRLTTPFNCLVGAGCFDTVAADDVGDNIFLFSGNYTGGLTLLNNQKLIGAGASASLATIAAVTVPTNSDPLPSTGGVNPVITTGGVVNAVVLGQGNTLRGFTSGNSGGAKISGNTFGTLTAGDNTTPDLLLNGTGQALNLTSGTFAATSAFSGVTTTSSGTQGINLAGIAGTVAFGSTTVSGNTTQCILIGTTTADINFGNTTCTGGTDGVSFQNNSSGTRTFGTLSVSGGSGNAFLHGAGGGNVTVNGLATLTSGNDPIEILNAGSGTLINFAGGATVTKSTAGGEGVHWSGTNTGATLTFNSLNVTTTNITGNTAGITASGGGAINVTNATGSISSSLGPAITATGTALNANFSSVSSAGSTFTAIGLTNVTGTSNFGGGSLSTAAGATFFVSGGTASVIYGGGISQGTNQPLVSVGGGHNSGTITFQTGTLNATNGTGLQFDNADGIYNFNGTTTLNGGDAGVDILNGSGGSFTFGANTSITSPTGIAFNIDGTASTVTASVTYSGNITQANNAATVNVKNHSTGSVTFQTVTLSGTSGSGLQFDNADGSYSFLGTNTLNGGDAGIDILNGSAGIFLFSANTAITNPSGVAYREDTSTANVTFNGTITKNNNANNAVLINAKTGGTSAFNGAITASTTTANAISLTNTGGTVNFTGGLNLTTTSGVAFNAAGSGATVSATQDNTTIVNTLTATTGTALNVANTSIGASGLTFRSITSNGSGTANGIILDTTGSSGGLTVTGNGSACTSSGTCTGGTISNKTGADGSTTQGSGIFLNSTSNVSITRMQFNDFQNFAIRGTSVTGFTLDNAHISGLNGDNVGINEGSISFDGLFGTTSITNSDIRGGRQRNIKIINSSGTGNITISGNTIRDTSTLVGGDDNLFIQADNSATITAHVQNNTFKNSFGDHMQVNTLNSATMTIVFTGNFYSAPDPAWSAGALGGGITISGGNAGSSEHVNFNISNNGSVGSPLTGSIQGGALNINQGSGGGTWQGQVSGNFIGDPAIANSGSAQSSGIRVENHSVSGTMTAIVNGNAVSQWNNGAGINFQVGDTGNINAALNLTVTNNNVNTPGAGSQHGIVGNFGADVNGTNAVCADIKTNTVNLGAVPPNGGANIRVRQRNGSTVRLPGYGGANTDTTAVNTFLAGQNTLTPAGNVTSSVAVPPGGGFIGGAACAQPTVPTTPVTIGTSSTEAPVVVLAKTNIPQPQKVNVSAATLPLPSDQSGEIASTSNSAFGGKSLEFNKAKRDGGTVLRYSTRDTFAPIVGQRPIASQGKKARGVITIPKGPRVNGSGGTVSINIGTLAAGDSVTITFQVTIDNPYSGGPNVSNQGTVSGTNFTSVLTDDPAFGGATDPTLTPVSSPPNIKVSDAQANEPPSGSTPMLFTVSLTAPAPVGGVTVHYSTADQAPGAGHAVANSDYTAVPDTVLTFASGEQFKTVSVDILSDAVAGEPDETFLLNLSNPIGGNILDGQAVGTIKQGSAAGTFLISELRTSGPGGAGDDFVEFYNNTDAPLTVNSSDATAGYGLFKMGADCNAAPILIGTIPNNTVIPARGHYLMVGSSYSLGGYATGDLTLTADIDSDANVAVFSTADVNNISSVNRLDAVGFGTNSGGGICDLLREGTNLPPLSGSTLEYSFQRDVCGKAANPGVFGNCPSSTPVDTNNNNADFLFADTTGANTIAGQRLGAPGPENLASPIQRNSTIGAVLLDATKAAAVAPNRVRDLTNSAPPNTNNGTLSIRRRFVNNTGASVTRLRFRVIDITAFPTPGGIADLRALTSASVVVSGINDTATCLASTGSAVTPCTVTVQGTTLEAPPNQAMGGALNSTLAAGTITLGTPLTNGASVNVQFLLGVQTTGSFKFYVNIEALP